MLPRGKADLLDDLALLGVELVSAQPATSVRRWSRRDAAAGLMAQNCNFAFEQFTPPSSTTTEATFPSSPAQLQMAQQSDGTLEEYLRNR